MTAQVKPTTATHPPAATPDALPAAYPASMPVNYIRTWVPSMPTTDSQEVMSPSRSTAEVKQTTEYFDGLGRPLQTVTKAITPDGKDLVAPRIYDNFGREVYKYLPYPQTTGNTQDGSFKSDPFTDQKDAIDDLGLYPGEAVYYSKTNYEASPLNRILKTMAPGNSWAGSGRGVSQSYEVNTSADGVRVWNIAGTAGSLPVSTASYSVGALYKNMLTDESGHRVVEFKDKQGRIILKRVAMSTSATDGHTGWLCTYYVYDDLNKLRFVISPRAVQYLQAHSWTLTQAITDALCFQYGYDERGRMIVKQVPGAEEVEMVYDPRDRLVFSQDGHQREADQWIVYYYDALNRLVETGLYTDVDATRQSLQSQMNTLDETSGQIPAVDNLTVSDRSGNTPSVYVARNSITFTSGFTSGTSDAFTTLINPSATVDNPNAGNGTNPLPPIDASAVVPLTYTYYDDYSWTGHQAFQSGQLSKTTDGGNQYGQHPTTYSKQTRGMVTGTKTRVLGSSPGQWLTSTTYYDQKGRVLQVISTNLSGGTDVVTNRYDFSGKLLSSYTVNHNSQSTLTPETRVLTENLYDDAGRLSTITKTLNDQSSTKRTISANFYNELGQLDTTILGNNLEILDYKYNIRGWLRSINPDYAGGSGSHYFGMELDYDYGFTTHQYNGNIAGQRWRSSGDGERRAYGYSYDGASRLTKADFTQYTGSAWDISDGVNYTVSNLTYDANGNIKTMKQMGLISGSSGTVDNMTYSYQNGSYSNRLDNVAESGGTSTALGDFKDKHTGSADYDYDANGNLTEDLNKAISSITYNYLNLPEKITFTGKGNIRFVYDATGNKLQKIVTDNTTSPSKTVVTNYIDGFVYQHTGSTAHDTLQFFPTENGRVRYVPAHQSVPAAYVYDYFIKDHLGNVRVVLTEQTDFSQYLATMEQPNAPKEEALFYNLDNTRTIKPPDYPQDNITTPNTAVAQLNGQDPNKRIGPSIILKVMAGDTIEAAVRAFYRQQVTEQNNSGLPAEQMLAGLLHAFTSPALQGGTLHRSTIAPNASGSGPGLTAEDWQSLQQKNPAANQNNKPKAYLNYVFFDNQLKFVGDGSGVKQVDGQPGELETLSSGQVVAKKSGYVYVYTSNESNQDVLFDNLGVTQITGPVLEETHYYPFGLTMSAISTQAPLKLENRFKFNGKELNHKEFSDGVGLEWYDYGARMYDAQLGRFSTIDRFSEKFIGLSPYQYGADNPIRFIDINGDSIIIPKSLTDNFIANEAFNNFASSKQGIKFLSQFARKGQIIAGHTYRKSGKYDNKRIDISYGTERIEDMDHGGVTKDFLGKNGRLTINVLVNTYEKRRTYNEIINTTLGANPTTKQLADQYGKMIFSRTGTIFHESFIHAELTAQDFMDNGKVDYSNISSQNKIGGVGNWQHNQVYYNNIKNMWPGDAYRALIDINGNMNLNYTNKQILQNIWFYNGGKEIQ
jgi:RHS repeat-associated protein